MTGIPLPVSRRWAAPLAAAAVLLPARAWALPANLLDWPNSVFGVLFAALTLFTIAISLLLRVIVRDTGDAAPTSYLEPLTVAYLAGGPDRAFLVALLELMESEDIRFRDDQKIELTNRLARPYNPFLTQLRDGFSIEDAKRVSQSALLSLRTTLVDDGLILDAQRAGLVRLTPILLFVPVIAFGLLKVEVGQARHHAVGFLVLLLVVLVAGLIAQYLQLPWRTMAGDKALKGARRKAARPGRAPREADLAHAVALTGAGALTGTAFAVLAEAIKQLSRASGGESRDRKGQERRREIIAMEHRGGGDAPSETADPPEHRTEGSALAAVADLSAEAPTPPDSPTSAEVPPIREEFASGEEDREHQSVSSYAVSSKAV